MLLLTSLALLQGEITVERRESTYRAAEGTTSGFFRTGQAADLMLSGVDFGRAGGPLLFNHPGGIASGGGRLLLADRNNNRVLVWLSLPDGNVPPDLVLGQPDLDANGPGTGLGQLNWPIGVATDGTRVLVTDVYNDRVLIWNAFPSRSAQPADFELRLPRRLVWPWAVWTDGRRVIVTSTGARSVLIWNTFPARGDQPPDVTLTAGGDFGTPRSIGSDGRRLAIGDHNAFGPNHGTFVWRTFPTRDAPYDFFIADPGAPGHHTGLHGPGDLLWGPVFTADGRFLALGAQLYVWNAFPESADDRPDVTVGSRGPDARGFRFEAGDGSGMCLAGDRLYLSLSNGNRIVAFGSIPASPDARPDFAVGSPDVATNTLETHGFITNGVPAGDGESLFVSSDFDRKLYVWRRIPDESGARPDFVYRLPDGAWDNDLHDGRLVLAGRQTLYVWSRVPRDGERPDRVIRNQLGGVRFQQLAGVALDARRLYLADSAANRIYAWEGIPSDGDAPAVTIETEQPRRLSSDGRYLAVNSVARPGGTVLLYRLDGLSAGSPPISLGGRGRFNLPEQALLAGGHLFVCDTGFSRVLVWRDVEDAVAGRRPDVVLGEDDLEDHVPEIGREKMFWPGAAAFDGRYLWVGEFKFSGRLLRFSPQP